MNVKKRYYKLRIILFLLSIVLAVICGYYVYKQYLYWRYPLKFEELVTEYAVENNLDPSFVFAVIRTESSYNPSAISRVGARGLMQVTEETKDWIMTKMPEEYVRDYINSENDDLLDAGFNILCGTFLLRFLYDEFKEWDTVLCAYNAGRGRALEWLSNPEYSSDGRTIHTIPFPETRQYVERVNEYKKIYEKLYFNSNP